MLLTLLPLAERLPAEGRTLELEPLVPLGRTVLLLPLRRTLVSVLLLELLLTLGRAVMVLVVERCAALLLVEAERFTWLLLLTLGRALGVVLTAERLKLELLLVTVAALFLGEAVATLRLPVAAAPELVAGRRPCAIAPVDVMASPHASIKPIIVL